MPDWALQSPETCGNIAGSNWKDTMGDLRFSADNYSAPAQPRSPSRECTSCRGRIMSGGS